MKDFYTLAQAAKAFSVPRAALCQAITYGQVTTVLKADPDHPKANLRQAPLHHIDHEEMTRFQTLYRSPGYDAPGFVANLISSRHNPRRATAPMSPEEAATRAARDVVDDRNAARELNMTLAEYREVAL